jgi:hypothetical protein
MRTRRRIHPYVRPELATKLVASCAAKGITESAAVEAAIEAYLAGDERDNEVILRRLDRLTRASSRHQRDLELLIEMFALYLRAWYAHSPEFSEEEKAVRLRLGQAKYQRFLDLVAERLGRGVSVANDLSPKSSTDDSPTQPHENHGVAGAERR